MSEPWAAAVVAGPLALSGAVDTSARPKRRKPTAEELLARQLTRECVCGHVYGHHQPTGPNACAAIGCDCSRFWVRKDVAGSPTARSVATMHNQRYLCQVVEHWVPAVKIRRDLYGFIDVLCVKGEEIVGIQATSGDGGNFAARIHKIVEHANYPLVIAAMRIVVHGWRKNAAGRWVLREEEL